MQVAWLAGLLEGEACFSIGTRKIKGKEYKRVCIQLVMTDEDVMLRAANMLGATCRPEPWRKLSTKPTWRANVYGSKAIGWMMTIYQFMGERRQEKIRECIRVWKEAPGRTNKERATLSMRNEAVQYA